MLILPGVRRGRFFLCPLGTDEIEQTYCEHKQEGETDVNFAPSRPFSRIRAAPYHPAHACCRPPSTLASSPGRLSCWPPVSRSRSEFGTGRKTTAAPFLISWRSTPFNHRTGSPAVGGRTSVFCHTVELASSRLLVCSSLWNARCLWIERPASTAYVCQCWHHRCSPHSSTRGCACASAS